MQTANTLFKIFIGSVAVLVTSFVLLAGLSTPDVIAPPLSQKEGHAPDTIIATSSEIQVVRDSTITTDTNHTTNAKSTKTSPPPPPLPSPPPPPRAIFVDPVISEIVPEKQNVSVPGPLVVRQETIREDMPHVVDGLTAAEIVRLSNIERAREGLAPLTWNTRLGAIAEAKAFDMIAKQYFAHESPDGTDISKLAEKYGYAYLNIGENLALGDFATSGAVVAGWMNSPGHRANIMSTAFREIGVAALRGTWEGRTVWFAVQEFGRPLSECPMPSATLKAKIALWEDQVGRLLTTLEGLKQELEEPGISRESYNAKVHDYNAIVTLYNKLVGELKADIAAYNAAVDAFNVCAVDK